MNIEEERDRGAGQHRADHTGEQDGEPDERRRDDGEPGRPGGERADADEDGARRRERDLRDDPLAHRTAEVDEQEQRERAERGERRDRRVVDDLVPEREDARA